MSAAVVTAHVITPQRTQTEGGKKRWLPICSCGWVGVTTRTEETAMKVGTTDHVERQLPSPTCPTPGKKRFKTRGTAESEMRKFWQTSGRGKPMPTRVYECPCGRWHMTAKPQR